MSEFKPLFDIGQPNDAYAQYFDGQSYLSGLAKNLGVGVANVTFEPGCRNHCTFIIKEHRFFW